MKLGLGTAQFGAPYGISNKNGQPSTEEISAILTLAAAHGIEVLDTAPAYGESEARLGQCLPPDHRFRIVTKSPLLKAPVLGPADAKHVSSTLRQSLKALRQDSVDALLIHHGVDLLKPGGELIVQEMKRLQAAGLVRKIGVSVYRGEDLDRLLDMFKPDIVQLPFNVLDQRLLHSGHLTKLKRAGIEIHARSVFLQGLLLMDPETLGAHFEGAKKGLKAYQRYLQSHQLTLLQGPLAFVHSLGDLLDVVLVGVCSVKELEQILAAIHHLPLQNMDFMPFACSDENIVNPSLWKTTVEKS